MPPEYMFEVVQKMPVPSPYGAYAHVGYMKALFKTKKAAALYYKQNNPRMPAINAASGWASASTATGLRYIVRKRHGLVGPTVLPFKATDVPAVVESVGGTAAELLYLPRSCSASAMDGSVAVNVSGKG